MLTKVMHDIYKSVWGFFVSRVACIGHYISSLHTVYSDKHSLLKFSAGCLFCKDFDLDFSTTWLQKVRISRITELEYLLYNIYKELE